MVVTILALSMAILSEYGLTVGTAVGFNAAFTKVAEGCASAVGTCPPADGWLTVCGARVEYDWDTEKTTTAPITMTNPTIQRGKLCWRRRCIVVPLSLVKPTT